MNAVISDRKVVDVDYVAGLEFEFSGVAYPTWTATSGCGTPTYAVTAGKHVITTAACAVTLQRSEAVVAGKTYTFSVELDRTNFASFDVVLEFSTTIGGTYTPVAAFTNVANGQISHTYYAAANGFFRYSFKKVSTNAGTFSMDNLRFGRVNTQYLAVVKMKADYYPFGMMMPGRNTNSADYRYGYNGMEKDPELKGEGNSYTTEFRQYDPRLGRWMSLDPLMMQFPDLSPYVAFDNNPVYYTDPYGLSAVGGGPDDGPIKSGDIVTLDNGDQIVFQADEFVVEADVCNFRFEAAMKSLAVDAVNSYFAIPTFSVTGDYGQSTGQGYEQALDAWRECKGYPPPIIPAPVPVAPSSTEALHTVLDILGLIPGLGEASDAVNAIIYASEGNYVDAGISLAAMVPILGSAGTILRLEKKVASAVMKEAEQKVVEDVGQGVSRRQAMQQAKEHASVPRNSQKGEDIDINDLKDSSRGPNWEQQKANGARRMGRRNTKGKNEWQEHPDGHPDRNAPGAPVHHKGGHFHSINSKGVEKVFPYKN